MSKIKPSPLIEAVTPFPYRELDKLWEWIEAARKQVADDFSFATPGEFFAEELNLPKNIVTFGILRDGELGGYVKAVQTSPIVIEAHCIFKQEFYGSATTIPALSLVARQLFDCGIERITMPVWAHNAAIKKLIQKLGGVEEGRLRNYTKQNGEPVDLAIFGLLKADFEKLYGPAPILDNDAWQQQHQSSDLAAVS